MRHSGTIFSTGTAAALLLLASCGSQDRTDSTAEPEAAADPAANLLAETSAEDPARLQARVTAAMAAVLRNPSSATYSNVRSGAGGSICGEVDLKGGKGGQAGPRPLLVTPQGAGFVSMAPSISFGDPSDPFPDLYIQYCATPAELRVLGPRLQGVGVGSTFDAAPPPDLSDLPPPDAEPPPATPEPAPAPGKARDPGPEPDSFFDAVKRK